MSLAVNCNDPGVDNPKVILDTSYDFGVLGGDVSLNMTMDEDWTVTVKDGGKWCTVDKKSGSKGANAIKISVAQNETYSPRKCSISVNTKHSVGKIAINQAQLDVLSAEPAAYDVPPEGGEYTPAITANVEYTVSLSADWLEWNEGVLAVSPNPGAEARSATVTLAGGGLTSLIAVTQRSEDVTPPEPPDELDGIVTQLRSHTRGGGIPIVIIGDAFPHDQVADDTYGTLVRKAADAFFTVEPYTTFEDMFDVYQVNVVSGYYEDFNTPGSTALGTYFGSGTYVNGDYDKCREYALKAVPEDIIDNTLVIILMNREVHAGRCWMQFVRADGSQEEIDDCARGIAYAFMALGTDDDDFTGLVHHEAGGHGFGRLADEYFYGGTGQMPQETIDEYKSIQKLFHTYRNIDFTSDPETVLWARLLQDERYAGEDLGVFEGACTWEFGAWRPSQASIMISNEGVFDAPSRQEIFYRIHKIAYGMEWEYDYEAFVEYDAINRNVAQDGPEPVRGLHRSTFREPCLPPVILR